ncbi:glucose dehydrogenase [FAD, quinone]-like isoform X1 [Ostrinia furnacalis]|uniref:glucose dehydrogenase [FAD, quinone]-like isoform X1 n=2 Tax=Ostrinia furnacalis TaxID=93504 RepID=UPI001039ABA3|nr:glucose dehydrogenase [FAD, quinone]-like isoform X1 [Ostrinia furnacalis]
MSFMLGQPEAAMCAAGGSVSGAVTAALQFFALAQCLVQEPWPKAAHPTNDTTFDYIVVGAGTAGSVLSSRLADLDGVSVLLIEAGGDPPQESIIPGYHDVLKGTKYDWNFTTVNDKVSSQALKGGSQKQPRGKMLGGSGSLSDMVYSRGHPEDYDDWAAVAGEQWNWKNVLEYFKKTEHMTDEQIVNNPELMAYHGIDGEIEVTGTNRSTFATQIFLDAFAELGFEKVKDMTNPQKMGTGRFSHTIRKGQRDSAATALLNKAGYSTKLSILKDSLVTKVIIDDKNKAVGVEVVTDNEKKIFKADKEVILSAGTFNTAKLLLLSGIGPKKHLEEMGIPVIKDLPVGHNFHDHVMVVAFLASEKGTCTEEQKDTYMHTIEYLHSRTGPLADTDSMGAYIALERESHPTVPDFAMYPTCVPVNAGFYKGCQVSLGYEDRICRELDILNQNYELIPVAVVLLKPKSRGKVTLSSKNPFDAPLIYAGTFSDEEDLAGFPKALSLAYSLANATYFRGKRAFAVDLKLEACEELRGAEGLKCHARQLATPAWHAVGTSALGAVLDGALRVRGVRGLRVADAGVMPAVVRGNTNAAVVMVAERAADFIQRELRAAPGYEYYDVE